MGGIILVHLQIALLTAWLLAAWAAVSAVRASAASDRSSRSPAAGLIALAVSSWWWIPRVAATIASGGLLLGGFPGAPPLRLGPGDLVMAFGVVAIFGLLGLAVLAARRPLPGRLSPSWSGSSRSCRWSWSTGWWTAPTSCPSDGSGCSSRSR